MLSEQLDWPDVTAKKSQIPFVTDKDKDHATIDIIGVVQDELKHPIGNARETVKLSLDESRQVRRKNVQYNTAFVLPPGKFHIYRGQQVCMNVVPNVIRCHHCRGFPLLPGIH